MLPDDAIEVGHVVGAWGVQGAVKVAAQSSDAAALLHSKNWWLRRPQDIRKSIETSISYDVVSKRIHGDGLVAMLATVTDRDMAAALAGATILIPRSAFPKASKDEFYWVDLIGCLVVNRDGQTLGRVVGLIETGVHSVLRVMTEPHTANPVDAKPGQSAHAEDAAAPAERLIPFVDAYVDKTDLKARRIDVDWGLDY